MVAVIYLGTGSGTRAIRRRLHTTRFRSGELRLPLTRPGAFLVPLSQAYGVHSTDAGQVWDV